MDVSQTEHTSILKRSVCFCLPALFAADFQSSWFTRSGSSAETLRMIRIPEVHGVFSQQSVFQESTVQEHVSVPG